MTRITPPRRHTNNSLLTNVTPLSRHVARQYHLLGTWKAVGAKIGISGGMAFRIATQGYKPSDPAIRRLLRRSVALDYDGWRQENMTRLQAIVDWAISHIDA